MALTHERRRGGGHRASAVVAWVLVVAWAVVIFLMSARTGADLTAGDTWLSRMVLALKEAFAALFGPESDVVSSAGHFLEYTVFGALLANALRFSLPPRAVLLVAVICGSLYGVTDEIHQIFVPGRFCDPLDWLVDTCGTALGALIMSKVLSKYRASSARRTRSARKAMPPRQMTTGRSPQR